MVTIVMTDLRGFSAISEKLPPETVVEMLNNYLSSMTDIIFKYSGTINEIIGDAILILFGAPTMRSDDADRAIACALDMQIAMKKVNQLNKKCGLPELEMGIGINTGKVVAGNIGSDMRVQYTVIGNNVNLAGRVESFTVGGQVLITESTLKATSLNVIVGGKLSISFKGLEKPVNVYDITGVNGEYEISLPQSKMAFLHLAEEISMSFEILDGKYCSGEKRQGRILKLAEKAAIFSSETELTELTNLKVIFNDYCGCGVDYIMYAKVMKVSLDEFNCYEMRFTFIPQEIRRYFDEVLKVN
jgi:adenylate cyclase